MDPIARRGDSLLSEQDLQSHLALGVQAENLGALAGAGTSKCCGGQLMTEIWAAFRDANSESVDWLESEHFLPTTDDGTAPTPNLEELLDAIAVAESDLRRRSATTDLATLARHRTLLLKVIYRAAILEPSLWDESSVPSSTSQLRPHGTFLARILASRAPGQEAPWIFTTNYDLAFEWAAEVLMVQVINGFLGLHERRFSASTFDLGFRRTHARGQAQFGTYHLNLVKLHGSLSWAEARDGGVVERAAGHVWPSLSAFLDGDEVTPPGILILPNSNKYLATTGFVYGELIRRFTEFLARPQTVLLSTGYSFSDAHLNRIIIGALQNPTLHIVAFLPELTPTHLRDRSLPDGISESARTSLQGLLNASSPRVTLVAGDAAKFEEAVNLLPEPVLLDESGVEAARMARILQDAETRQADFAPDPEAPEDA